MSSRFYRWCTAGIIADALKRLQASADARGAIDWDPHFVDATVIHAHQQPLAPAGPASSGDEASADGSAEALGRSQGGFSTKQHLRAEGGGKPIAAVLTGGERQEQLALPALLDRGLCSDAAGADRAYGLGAWRATRATPYGALTSEGFRRLRESERGGSWTDRVS